MIYFDNAATSFPKPPSVERALQNCLKNCFGNPGRSSHLPSIRAAEEIFSVREEVASFLHSDSPEKVVFTLNATHALNLCIKAFCRPNMNVMISDLEHNAVFRPVEKLKKELGISVTVFRTDGDLRKNLEEAVTPETGLLIFTLCSNVSGRTVSLKILSEFRKKHPGIRVVADGSQAFGHTDIDLGKYPVDAFCAPGHKGALGIAGCGFAWFEKDERLPTLTEGGSGSHSESPEMPDFLPERMEAGTPPTPAVSTLGAGIRWIRQVGVEDIERRLFSLSEQALDGLNAFSDAKVVEKSHSGVISFVNSHLRCTDLSQKLSERGICVRAGLHCAPLAHKTYGTEKSGTVRISFSAMNTPCEIERFLFELKRILKA